VPARYAIDLNAAEERFRQASRALHPDRFATADPRARRFATGRTVQLNEAWRTVKDPVRRAEYLLARAGFEVAGEAGAFRPGVGGTKEKLTVPPALLGEILELREELAEARAAGALVRVEQLQRAMRARRAEALEALPGLFATGDLAAIKNRLIVLRYIHRYLEECDAALDED